jgi:hypothetical protein
VDRRNRRLSDGTGQARILYRRNRRPGRTENRGRRQGVPDSADLTVDGIAGPATRAALHRALVTRLANRTSAAGGIAAGGTDAAIDTALSPNPLPQSEPPPLPDGLIDAVGPAIALGAVAASIWVGFWVWRNRGRLFAWLPEGLKDFIQDRTGIVGGRRVAA